MSDTTATSSVKTKSRPSLNSNPLLREFGISLVILAAVLLWVGPSLYRQDLVFLAATYSLIALGMYVPFVMAGALSMAYSAYAAIGAYAVAIVSVKWELTPWLGWVLAIVVSGAVALVLAFATKSLSGFYLAAVTLLFAVAFELWLGSSTGLTGGAAGISSIPIPAIFGYEPPRLIQVVASVLFVCTIAVVVERVRRSSWGLAISTSRENAPAVRSSGIAPQHLRVVAIVVGAGIASTGGALFTVSVQAVTPETFGLEVVFLAIFMPIIGGRLSAWGAPLGALIVVAVTLNMPGYQGSGELLLAAIVLLILLIAPGGVIGWVAAAVAKFKSAAAGKESSNG